MPGRPAARVARLLCGVVVGLSVLSGVAYAAPDGGDGHAARRGDQHTGRGDQHGSERGDRRGGAGREGCEGDGLPSAHRRTDGDDGQERSTRRSEADDPDEPDGSDVPNDPGGSAARRVSCGGRGGAPGLNSSSCGSSLLPAGVSLAPCGAPPARRGQDG